MGMGWYSALTSPEPDSQPWLLGLALGAESPQRAQVSQTSPSSGLSWHLELPTPESSSCGVVLRILSTGDVPTVQSADDSEATWVLAPS